MKALTRVAFKFNVVKGLKKVAPIIQKVEQYLGVVVLPRKWIQVV